MQCGYVYFRESVSIYVYMYLCLYVLIDMYYLNKAELAMVYVSVKV